MARTINEIQQEIIRMKNNEPDLADLTNTKKTAAWRIMTFVIASAIWVLEELFELHLRQVNERLRQLKPHTARWYRNKALAFQYGFGLINETDRFDNGNSEPEDIENSKIVKYAAVVESEENGRLIIKIATEKDNELSPITTNQEEAIVDYFARIKDAGVVITIINYQPDRLKLNIRVKRDVLTLNQDGIDINTGKYPVKDAIKEYMKELPFNGELSLQALTDKIQRAKGVLDVSIDMAQSSWLDGESNDYGDWEDIDMSVLPKSGYFVIDFEGDENLKSIIAYV